MLRGVGLLCGRGWDVGHALILMLLAELDPVFQMSQDKVIPMIAFGGPIMQILDIRLAYDPAI
jgi:hypothetical protein